MGVGALHAALGAALLFGLAVSVVPLPLPPEPIVVTLQKPKEPVVKKLVPPVTLDEIRIQIDAPTIEIEVPLPTSDMALPPAVDPFAKGVPGGGEAAPPPPLPPEPVRLAAVPRGGTVGLSTEDYPDASRRAGEEGQTTLSFMIGVDGRVSGCEIARSSGHERLDAKACLVAERRWRFAPATVDGKPVETRMSRKVTWQLRDMR